MLRTLIRCLFVRPAPMPPWLPLVVRVGSWVPPAGIHMAVVFDPATGRVGASVRARDCGESVTVDFPPEMPHGCVPAILLEAACRAGAIAMDGGLPGLAEAAREFERAVGREGR